MSDNTDSWKEIVALAALILAVSLSLSTCRYIEHRIDLEKQHSKTAKPAS